MHGLIKSLEWLNRIFGNSNCAKAKTMHGVPPLRRFVILTPAQIRNPYVRNAELALNARVDTCRVPDLKRLPVAIVLKKPAAVILNWPENRIDRAEIWAIPVQFVALLLTWLSAKLTKTHLFWTYHNRSPHRGLRPYSAAKFMALTALLSDVILVHAQSAGAEVKRRWGIRRRVVWVPHGSYERNLGAPLPKPWDPHRPLTLGIVGRILSYKNVPNLIRAAGAFGRETLRLRIFGDVKDPRVTQMLQEQSLPENVEIHNGYIPDDEIPIRFADIHLAIIGHRDDSAIVSGYAFLAFSMATPIIAPNVGWFREMSQEPFVFVYDDWTDLLSLLRRLVFLDRFELFNAGRAALHYTRNNDWDKYADRVLRELRIGPGTAHGSS